MSLWILHVRHRGAAISGSRIGTTLRRSVRRDSQAITDVYAAYTESRTRRKKLLGFVKLSENSTRSLATLWLRGRGSIYIYMYAHTSGPRSSFRRPLETDACVERVYIRMKETKSETCRSPTGMTLKRKLKRSLLRATHRDIFALLTSRQRNIGL